MYRVAWLLLCAIAAAFVGCKPPALVMPLAREQNAKISRVHVRIPARGQLAPLVGRMQRHRIESGETLLDVARDAGLGFEQVHAANPGVDEWIPKAGIEVVVPSRWIVPRCHYRGLVINIPEMRLYVFPTTAPHPGSDVALRTWAIGIGTDDRPSPVGSFSVVSKEENPTWFVPPSIQRTMDPPRAVVPPGPDNPLGAYRLRLSKGLYEIHGTNVPWSIGRLTTHGCIRLYPEDIAELYHEVRIGTPGELLYQPVKFGELDGRIYVEVHRDVYGRIHDLQAYAGAQLRKLKLDARVDSDALGAAVREQRGVPIDVTRR